MLFSFSQVAFDSWQTGRLHVLLGGLEPHENLQIHTNIIRGREEKLTTFTEILENIFI